MDTSDPGWRKAFVQRAEQPLNPTLILPNQCILTGGNRGSGVIHTRIISLLRALCDLL